MKPEDRPAPLFRYEVEAGIRVYGNGMSHCFQQGKIGDAIGIEGTFLRRTSLPFQKLEHEPLLLVPKSRKPDQISRSSMIDELEATGDGFGYSQITGQGLNQHVQGRGGKDHPGTPA